MGYVRTVGFICCRLWRKKHMLQYVWIMCVLLDLYVVGYGVRNMLQYVWIMCVLLDLYVVGYGIRNICCSRFGLCAHCWIYML